MVIIILVNIMCTCELLFVPSKINDEEDTFYFFTGMKVMFLFLCQKDFGKTKVQIRRKLSRV